MRRIKKGFLNLKIHSKLFIPITLLVILPMFGLSTYFMKTSFKIINEKSEKYILDTMHQAGKNMDDTVRLLDSILFKLATGKEMQSNIVGLDENDATGLAYQNHANNLLTIISETINPADEIKAVLLVTKHKNTITVKRHVIPIYDQLEDVAYKGNGSTIWLGNKQNPGYITIVKAVIDLSSQKPIGYLIVEVDQAAFMETLNNMHFTESENIFILNKNYESIITPQSKVAWQTASRLRIRRQEFPNRIGMLETENKADLQGVVYVNLRNTDWTIVAPYEDMASRAEIQTILGSTVVLIAASIGLVLFVSWSISKYFSKAINKVKESFVQFSKGDFHTQIPIKTNDEIGELSAAFNTMVIDIGVLVHKLDEERNAKLKAELKALQMQINPHFLYNTLDTISWMATLKNAPKIAEVTQNLAQLMRYSISKEDFVLILQEIDAVNSYRKIQQYRMPSLKIKIEIEDDLLEEIIPKQIILPMLENAVEHGLSRKVGEDKWIRISGYSEEENIYLMIEDNGVGITQQRIDEIFNKRNYSWDNYESIGIINVHNRIRLHYGEQYGVRIVPSETGGTIVILKIPKEGE